MAQQYGHDANGVLLPGWTIDEESGQVLPPPPEVHALTPQQVKARRSRNIAIALTLVALVILFFAMTIVRLGGNVMNRP